MYLFHSQICPCLITLFVSSSIIFYLSFPPFSILVKSTQVFFFYLLMKKIEVQMLLYTLTKKIIEVQKNMLNEFGIILFYKVVWWFDGQDIGVKPMRSMFLIPITNIYDVKYVYSYMCKCIVPRWVVCR